MGLFFIATSVERKSLKILALIAYISIVLIYVPMEYLSNRAITLSQEAEAEQAEAETEKAMRLSNRISNMELQLSNIDLANHEARSILLHTLYLINNDPKTLASFNEESALWLAKQKDKRFLSGQEFLPKMCRWLEGG